MALILKLLEEAENKEKEPPFKGKKLIYGKYTCKNDRCITTVEQELTPIFFPAECEEGKFRCAYCEKKVKTE